MNPDFIKVEEELTVRFETTKQEAIKIETQIEELRKTLVKYHEELVRLQGEFRLLNQLKREQEEREAEEGTNVE